MAGYRDVIDTAGKDFSRHQEYTDATRAYNKDYGTLEDYRDGYRQGFEKGYDTGSKSELSILRSEWISKARRCDDGADDRPGRGDHTASRHRRNDPRHCAVTATVPQQSHHTDQTETDSVQRRRRDDPGWNDPEGFVSADADDPMIIIPRDTELILELQEPLDTERNREGDKFTAKVVAPQEIVGAIIEGTVDKIQKPGRIKKRSAMLLSFDRIIISETRWSNFDAIMTEVLPVKGDNVKRSTVREQRSVKARSSPTLLKVAGATGAGVGIGAIAGGPVGAAVGAGVGAAFGVGAVIIERGKHINLRTSQQLRIKTSYETKIR